MQAISIFLAVFHPGMKQCVLHVKIPEVGRETHFYSHFFTIIPVSRNLKIWEKCNNMIAGVWEQGEQGGPERGYSRT